MNVKHRKTRGRPCTSFFLLMVVAGFRLLFLMRESSHRQHVILAWGAQTTWPVLMTLVQRRYSGALPLKLSMTDLGISIGNVLPQNELACSAWRTNAFDKTAPLSFGLGNCLLCDLDSSRGCRRCSGHRIRDAFRSMSPSVPAPDRELISCLPLALDAQPGDKS